MSDDMQRKIAELRKSAEEAQELTKGIIARERENTAKMLEQAKIELTKLADNAADPATPKDVPRSRTWRDYFRWFGK